MSYIQDLVNLAQLIGLPGFDRASYEKDLRVFKNQQSTERKEVKAAKNTHLLREQQGSDTDLELLPSMTTLVKLMTRLHAAFANTAIRRTVDTLDLNGMKILALPGYHTATLVLQARDIERRELEKWGGTAAERYSNLVSAQSPASIHACVWDQRPGTLWRRGPSRR